MITLPRGLMIFLLLTAFLTVIFSSLQGCRREGKKQSYAPVKTAQVIEKKVPVKIESIGNVEAYSTVAVKSQVNGILTKVHFKEGDFVKKGEILFSIDPKPFDASLSEVRANLKMNQAQIQQAKSNIDKDSALIKEATASLERSHAQVQQAKANLEKDTIEEKNAEAEAKRQEYLLTKGFTTQQQYDKAQTIANGYKAILKADVCAIQNAQAQVKAAEASLLSAKANLGSTRASLELAKAREEASASVVLSSSIQRGYCNIVSPIDGRTGDLAFKEGNLIKAQDSESLVTINQIKPVYVNFSVPERFFNELKNAMSCRPLIVEATNPVRENEPVKGFVSFINNKVDTSTGMIQLKGTFKNSQMLLWPGQFVNVSVIIRVMKHALVVPATSVQSGQKGDYVFVIKPDRTAVQRLVKVDYVYKNEKVLSQGVSNGETVVTEGQMKLITGTKVEIVPESSSPEQNDTEIYGKDSTFSSMPEARGK